MEENNIDDLQCIENDIVEIQHIEKYNIEKFSILEKSKRLNEVILLLIVLLLLRQVR